MGERLGLRPHDRFAPLWVVDFPLLEWDDETQRYYAMHHPFTSPKSEDLALMDTDPGRVRANAYDFVVNGVEVGGGSIRIFDSELQQKMFRVLGFSAEEAEKQFGFLTNAFKYGAPPHGGIAFGVRPLVRVVRRSRLDPRLHRFPEEQLGPRYDDRLALDRVRRPA